MSNILINPYLSGGAVTVEYLDHGEEGANQITYEFTSVDFGSESGGRQIVVGISSFDTDNDTTDFDSITIGGESATIDKQHLQVNNFTQCLPMAFARAAPSGTSGTVSVTFTEQVNRCAIVVYRLLNFSSVSDSVDAGSAAGLSVSTGGLTVPDDGASIVYVYCVEDVTEPNLSDLDWSLSGTLWRTAEDYGSAVEGTSDWHSASSVNNQTGGDATQSIVVDATGLTSISAGINLIGVSYS